MITDKKSPYRLVTVEELAKLREREDKIFMERTPKSKEAFDKAHEKILLWVIFDFIIWIIPYFAQRKVLL